eukprot:UN28620
MFNKADAHSTPSLLALYGALMSKLGHYNLFQTTEIKKLYFTSFGKDLCKKNESDPQICKMIKQHELEVVEECNGLKENLVETRQNQFKLRLSLVKQMLYFCAYR